DLKYSSFKLWLLYAKRSHGTIVVDAGAARALRSDGTSLLPVGVVGVEGKFEPGDAVDVADEEGIIGKGIVNYSAADLEQAKGLKSPVIAERLPRAPSEAVHRDYFVLA
ncbi:MAG TPA: PUA domain-containing protein, partial [Baekduia sp.]|nr:PUA domain-containing protein [Baekduia sp.]